MDEVQDNDGEDQRQLELRKEVFSDDHFISSFMNQDHHQGCYQLSETMDLGGLYSPGDMMFGRGFQRKTGTSTGRRIRDPDIPRPFPCEICGKRFMLAHH